MDHYIELWSIEGSFLGEDDPLENEYWSFCPDDPEADTKTYDQFDLKPDQVFTPGHRFRINSLWGFSESGGLTETQDYIMVSKVPLTLAKAVQILLSIYHDNMKKANATGRYYFIEQARVSHLGDIVIDWGT